MIRSFSWERVSEYEDDLGEEYLCLFQGSPNHVAIVAQLKEDSRDNPKETYLYESDSRLGFSFYHYGGMNRSVVYVHHPTEDHIIQTITDLTARYESIQMPDGMIRKIRLNEHFGDHNQLDEWGRNFAERFSKFLPQSRPLEARSAT